MFLFKNRSILRFTFYCNGHYCAQYKNTGFLCSAQARERQAQHLKNNHPFILVYWNLLASHEKLKKNINVSPHTIMNKPNLPFFVRHMYLKYQSQQNIGVFSQPNNLMWYYYYHQSSVQLILPGIKKILSKKGCR